MNYCKLKEEINISLVSNYACQINVHKVCHLLETCLEMSITEASLYFVHLVEMKDLKSKRFYVNVYVSVKNIECMVIIINLVFPFNSSRSLLR